MLAAIAIFKDCDISITKKLTIKMLDANAIVRHVIVFMTERNLDSINLAIHKHYSLNSLENKTRQWAD